MKILLPIITFYPSQGGPSNMVYWMAKALVQKGVTMTIMTTNVGTEGRVPANQWMDTDYGRVMYHSTGFPLLPWQMLRGTIAAMPHCDLVHLNSLFYPPSLILAVAARWYGKPVIWSPHGELNQSALIYSPHKKKLFLWIIRRFLVKKTVFHSTSARETQRVHAVMGQQVQVAEIPIFLELPALVEPTPSTPPYLLYMGRIHPIKAIENLIAALAASPHFLKSALHLVIAGDDNNAYAKHLQEKVSNQGLLEKVRFIGHIEGETKQELFANAHFFILPSHTENFGNVVVESLAQGTPVIAATGTPWSVLAEEQAGFWVDNSPAALATAIEQALNLSADQYQHYRRQALALARQRFDILENVGSWIETYQQVIKNHPSNKLHV